MNWDMAKFGDAIQEVREMFHAAQPPDAWWTKPDHMWADAGRALGLELRTPRCHRAILWELEEVLWIVTTPRELLFPGRISE